MKIYQPREELRPYVRYYWALKSDKPFSTLTYPIGCPQIIFHRRTPLLIPELSSAQYRFTVSGQVNFPAHIASAGDTEMIVAVFYPHTVGMFIDTPPSEFYNLEISGFDIGDKALDSLAAGIFSCEDMQACVSMMDDWLLSRMRRRQCPRNMAGVGNAVGILMNNPSISVSELAATACLSHRQFGRIFNDTVGMMPKEYARVVRFQKSLWILQNNKGSYADIAYSCGYSDQSHFIRDFRQFSGLTPAQITNPYSDLFTVPA